MPTEFKFETFVPITAEKQSKYTNNQTNDRMFQTSQQKQQFISQNHQKITFKIKDGLYLGTSIEAFKDEQFILLNWIEHIIIFQSNQQPFDNQLKKLYGQENDAITEQGQQVIRYIHCNHKLFEDYLNQKVSQQKSNLRKHKDIQQIQQNDDKDNSFIQDLQDYNSKQMTKYINEVQKVHQFIQKAYEQGSSCLIITSNANENKNSTGSMFAIICSFLMKKYKWSLFKSLEYLNTRIKNVSLNQQAYDFLHQYQIQLIHTHNLTYDWQSYQSQQDLVLRNTFLNCKKMKLQTNQKNQIVNTSFSKQKITRKHSEIKIKKIKTQCVHNQIYPNQIAKNSFHLYPILKQSCEDEKKTSSKYKKKRIQINTSFNQIKQYFIDQASRRESQKDPFQQQQAVNIYQIPLQIQQINKSLQTNNKQQNYLQNSRFKQISLSVQKMISKYRQEKQKYSTNSQKAKTQKGLYFDDYYEMNLRNMNRKKGNCQIIPKLDQKLLKNQKIKHKQTQKNAFTQELNKILKKLKANKTQKISNKFEQEQNQNQFKQYSNENKVLRQSSNTQRFVEDRIETSIINKNFLTERLSSSNVTQSKLQKEKSSQKKISNISQKYQIYNSFQKHVLSQYSKKNILNFNKLIYKGQQNIKINEIVNKQNKRSKQIAKIEVSTLKKKINHNNKTGQNKLQPMNKRRFQQHLKFKINCINKKQNSLLKQNKQPSNISSVKNISSVIQKLKKDVAQMMSNKIYKCQMKIKEKYQKNLCNQIQKQQLKNNETSITHLNKNVKQGCRWR